MGAKALQSVENVEERSPCLFKFLLSKEVSVELLGSQLL